MIQFQAPQNEFFEVVKMLVMNKYPLNALECAAAANRGHWNEVLGQAQQNHHYELYNSQGKTDVLNPKSKECCVRGGAYRIVFIEEKKHASV
jgi:hypothetical protein